MTPTATSVASGSTTSTSVDAAAVAQAAAALVPASVPLVAVPCAAGDVPADAQAVVATFVGAPSADLLLIAGDALADVEAAGAAAGARLVAGDALRPALEAAAQVLGAGVLEAVRTEPVAQVLVPGAEVYALQHEGMTLAWFAVRVRAGQAPAAAATRVPTQRGSMRMLYDVDMTLTAQIGRTTLPVRQVLDLVPGTVLELDRAAGSPADVMVNGRLIARGEIVVVDEVYGVRITEIVTDDDGR
ncbi:flagellar motor switch protein FliN [Cellulomonas sp. DKR-3]|uniref:Flagellar motor switch protein FliN n=1 Tax=Cellulomonas fulva TaxID=2835530 RepID=A0ABS5TV77_9CELL|nr:flagellar motor switch protein FliN [Cellulomonas fulva]MBT0993063.1 flagellar motor switch protein FliN [Cellulomonas fulva]